MMKSARNRAGDSQARAAAARQGSRSSGPSRPPSAIVRPARCASLDQALAAALLRPGAVLEAAKGGAYELFEAADGCSEPVCRVEIGTVRRLEARGLVTRDPHGRLTLSAEGRRRFAARLGIDGGAARLLAQAGIAGEAGATRLVNEAESPLAWLGRRRGGKAAFLAAEEVEAGERLRLDFTRAGLEPRVTVDWSRPGEGRSGARGPSGVHDAVLDARTRVNAALGAVGPELSGILTDVCCFLRGLEEVEKGRAWPARSAKVVLRLALQRLARHYGLTAPEAAPPPGAAQLRSWGAAGYRPRMDGA